MIIDGEGNMIRPNGGFFQNFSLNRAWDSSIEWFIDIFHMLNGDFSCDLPFEPQVEHSITIGTSSSWKPLVPSLNGSSIDVPTPHSMDMDVCFNPILNH